VLLQIDFAPLKHHRICLGVHLINERQMDLDLQWRWFGGELKQNDPSLLVMIFSLVVNLTLLYKSCDFLGVSDKAKLSHLIRSVAPLLA